MAFFNNTSFGKPRSRKQKAVSTKWTRLGDPKEPSKGLRKVGKKGEFWIFVGKILNKFFLKIELPKTCEIVSDFCDNYNLTPAHTRRRQDIRTGDWWYALRVLSACSECHFWADAQGRRIAEEILEPIVLERFKRLGLSEADVKRLLLACAFDVQAEHPGKFDHFYVSF